MLCRIALLPLLLIPLVAPASAHAETARALQIDTVAHGIKLSLILPRSVYPRGALTRVTVRVQNLSRQSLGILPGFTDPSCAIDNPQVQSLTPAGAVRYPPAVGAIRGVPMPRCVGGSFGVSSYVHLAPGASRQTAQLVILGGSRPRAVLSLAPLGANNHVGRPFSVVGRSLQLRLVTAPRTRIERCPGTNGCFRVLPPAGAHVSGPLYYAYSAKCEDAKGNVAYGQQLLLTPSTSTTLHIGCGAPLVELHLVAGWLNQPVGRLDRVFTPGAGRIER